MKKTQKPLYVSTSIAYANGAPHVGFAMESIEADTIARWGRYQGREVFFSTGTDEHGEKIQRTAEANNTTPQSICDKNSAEFEKLGQALNISNDIFIRTSDKEKHWSSAQKLWKKLRAKGDVEKKEYTAKYCYGCEAFMLEKDLDEDGNCPNHKRPPEEISEENYFFKLSKYSQKIADLIESGELKIIPDFRKNEILNMAKEGFYDVSFSRPSKKLPWGLAIPDDDTQNMYVWCDALTNYISSLGYGEKIPSLRGGSLFQKFWNEGESVHVIGKDILRFHAGIWIGMLLSAGEKIPDKIFVHGFLTSEGHKMSKSLGNVVDPFGEVEKYGTDALRYFLLREVPIGKDADFSRSRFEEIYQAHLANGLGNLVSRVYTLCERSEVFAPSTEETLCSSVTKFLEEKTQNLKKCMDNWTLHDAIAEVMLAVEFCDQKINTVKPWDLIKTDPQKTKDFLSHILYVVLWIAQNITPFLPETGKKIQKIFGVYPPLRGGSSKFGKLQMLFPRIEKLDLPEKNNSVETQNIASLQSKKIAFSISPEAQDLGIVAEHILLDNIAVKKTPRGMQKFLKRAVRSWLESKQENTPEYKNWEERVNAQNKIKSNLGFSPENFPCAPQMLATLAEKNQKLPNVSNIVDLYNIVSLKYGLSAGAHDTAPLSEKAEIKMTTGEETFTPMTGKEHLSPEHFPIQKGEYAFVFGDGSSQNTNKIGCRFDAAQCEESKITEGNKNILVYFQNTKLDEEKNQTAKKAMSEFLKLLSEYGLG